MSFASDYLTQLEAFAAKAPPPRVRALHLPPRETEGEKHAEFLAVELADGSLGLTYALLGDTLQRLHAEAAGNDLAGADALAVSRRYRDGAGIERAIGFAAANALTRCLYQRAGYVPDRSGDSLGGLAPAAGEHIGMIGLFSPLIERVLTSGARLTVIELDPALAGQREGYRVSLERHDLADCAKVLSTSTLLLNDTLDDMLAACTAARWFAMVGPSAGCLPDALFARGVTVLGGTWVHDAAAYIDALRRGAERSAYAGKCMITHASYPGHAALLARL